MPREQFVQEEFRLSEGNGVDGCGKKGARGNIEGWPVTSSPA